MDNEDRKKEVRIVVMVLIAVNLILFISKWTPTLFYSSLSIKADSFNSLGDFAYSGLLLIGFEYLYRPKDESHPHGHDRLEPFVCILIAGFIAFTGIVILIEAFQNIADPSYEFTPIFLVVLLFSMLIKYWLFRYLNNKRDEIESTALTASAQDAKADILSSMAALGGVLGGFFGMPILDVFIGMIVSIWIFRTSYDIFMENVGYLTGASAPQGTIKKIIKLLEKKEYIISYHDLVAHHVGPKVHVSVSVHLPDDMEFDEVHGVEEELKHEICTIKNVDVVYLHLEPEKHER
ncbi:MAG: cation diffusion facilitator family transporter [Thermoplasmata archaeon]